MKNRKMLLLALFSIALVFSVILPASAAGASATVHRPDDRSIIHSTLDGSNFTSTMALNTPVISLTPITTPTPSQEVWSSYINTNIVSSLAFEGTPQTPPIYIQYHVWFTRGSCPSWDPLADWWHWSWSRDHDPCETPFPGAPWLRELSSPGYPLIGLYDSSNDEVLRWHIRLAKAAGVSGFFVSVYSFCTVCTPAERVFFKSNFSKMLDIAKEENFYLGIEDWQPLDLTDKETWKAEVQNQIDTFGSHPAFLRINGKPAIWFNFYLQWMSLDELTQFLDSRSTFWIVDGMTLLQLNAFKQKSTQAQATYAVPYNYPTTSGWAFTPDFESQLRNLASEGFVTIAHGYPGFDERAIPDREERRFGLRNNGQILNDFLSASVGGKAQAIILESFNDFAEYTQFEPGFDIKQYRDTGQEVIYSEDPYRYLEILADFKGVSWVTPMPPCSIVDSLLRQDNVVQCVLTISSTAGGNVTTLGEGMFTYDEGTVVNVTAVAEEGYRFVNWTGDVDTIANVDAALTIITMSGNYSIAANFEEKPPINWPLIGGIIAAVAVAGLAIFFVRRKRAA